MRRVVNLSVNMIIAMLLAMPIHLDAQYVDLLWDRIAHYPFIHDAVDISGFENHGAVVGATLTADRMGNPYEAYYFDGVDDHIHCGNDIEPIHSAVAVSCWIRTDDTESYSHIISKYDFSADGGFTLGTQGGIVIWAGRIGSGQYIRMTSKSRVDDDHWHHVIAMIDGSTWSFYLDGVLENQIETGYNKTDIHCTTPLTIGMYYNGDNGDHRHYKGFVDEVLIYKRALNACEIEVLFTGETYGQR